MSDICFHCTARGDIAACQAATCNQHDSWYAKRQQAEIKRQQAEIERLNARLKVLQDAQVAAVNGDHRNLFKHTIEVEYALWGKEQSDD